MLFWALIFLIVAIIAGAFGFRSVEGIAAGIAKVLFFIFIVLFLISLIYQFFYLPRNVEVITSQVVTSEAVQARL